MIEDGSVSSMPAATSTASTPSVTTAAVTSPGDAARASAAQVRWLPIRCHNALAHRFGGVIIAVCLCRSDVVGGVKQCQFGQVGAIAGCHRKSIRECILFSAGRPWYGFFQNQVCMTLFPHVLVIFPAAASLVVRKHATASRELLQNIRKIVLRFSSCASAVCGIVPDIRTALLAVRSLPVDWFGMEDVSVFHPLSCDSCVSRAMCR